MEPTTEITIEADTKAAGQRRAEARRKMKAALKFAHTGLGRAVMRLRAALGFLGPLGAALLALYPIAVALAVVLIGFAYSGLASPV